MRAHIGGLLLDGMDIGQQSTYTILDDKLSGWFEGPAVRAESIPIPGAHGEYDLPVFREPRIISIEGMIYTDSDFEQDQAINALLRVCADGQRERLTVESAAGSTSAMVRLSDGPEISRIRLGTHARYRMVLRASDPRRYGEERSYTGGAVQAFHYGNFPAKIQAVVRGPRAAGYEIQGPGGRRVVVAQELGSLDHHTIQFWSGRVYRNGTRQLGALTVFQPWTVPPGPPTSMSCPSGEMTINITDTYI